MFSSIGHQHTARWSPVPELGCRSLHLQPQKGTFANHGQSDPLSKRLWSHGSEIFGDWPLELKASVEEVSPSTLPRTPGIVISLLHGTSSYFLLGSPAYECLIIRRPLGIAGMEKRREIKLT